MGDHEGMKLLLDNEEVISKKNQYLQPLYRDLKSTIKHMTFTPEFKIMREYLRDRAYIVGSLDENSI
jgi:hypothetical protein